MCVVLTIIYTHEFDQKTHYRKNMHLYIILPHTQVGGILNVTMQNYSFQFLFLLVSRRFGNAQL